MFQEPLTAVMAMLFLYFAGVLVMFVFVIRSLASQGDERREAFRKQQLMLGDLERHLIDMKVMLRRLLPEHEDLADEGMAHDSSLSMLKQSDPLDSMLEAVSLAGKRESDGAGEAGPLSRDADSGRKGGQAFSQARTREEQGSQDSSRKASADRGGGIDDLAFPDFFGEQDSPSPEKTPLGAHMFPPHESLGKSTQQSAGPDKGGASVSGAALARSPKPINLLGLDGPGGKKQRPPAGKDLERGKDMPNGDDQPLRVFSIGKNPMLHGDLSGLEDSPLVPPFAARESVDSDDGGPVLSKSMESIRKAFSGLEDDGGAPAPSAQKPRLRVTGPSMEAATVKPAVPSGRQVPSAAQTRADAHATAGAEEKPFAGVGGALFAAKSTGFSRAHAVEDGKADEDGESLRHIYEEGLKAEDAVNLFDLEAEKEERKFVEGQGGPAPAGPARDGEAGDILRGPGEPVPQGFTIVQHSLRADAGLVVGQRQSLLEGTETPADGSVPEEAAAGQKLLSRRVSRYSFEVKPMEAQSAEADGVKPVQGQGAETDEASAASPTASSASTPLPSGPPLNENPPHSNAASPATGAGEPAESEAPAKDISPEDEKAEEDRQAVTHSLPERDIQAFAPRARHPIDKKILSKRKQPGKKGRHPLL